MKRPGWWVLLLLGLGCGPIGLMTVNTLARFGGYEVERGLPYGREATQRVDVYRPREAVDAPVVVFFHGGSWTRGSRADYTFVGEALTSQGFVVVIPDYRKFPEVTFPRFVEDGAEAVIWARARARELGGDPERLFVMGHSSGAHIAALLALDRHYLESRIPEEQILRGMIGLAGPYDFNARREDIRPIFVGVPYRATQPIEFAGDAGSLPLLLLHGEADQTVFKKNTVNLARAVRDAGGDVRTGFYPDCDHTQLLAALSIPMRGRWPVLADVAAFIRDPESPAP